MFDFSIITVVKFSEKTIKKNIISVKEQIHKSYEHIIVCHVNDDKSLKIIKKFKNNKISLIISNDSNLYEAMNIGIKHAKGNFITFLNADDVFRNYKVLKYIKKNIREYPKINSFYGDVEIVKNKQIYRKWNSGNFSRTKFFFGWHPPHPSLFLRKNISNHHVHFDTKFKIAADYELMIRLFVVKNISSKYCRGCLVKMTHGGLSSKKFSNIILSNIESYLAWKKHGYFFLVYIVFLKPLRKVFQLFVR